MVPGESQALGARLAQRNTRGQAGNGGVVEPEAGDGVTFCVSWDQVAEQVVVQVGFEDNACGDDGIQGEGVEDDAEDVGAELAGFARSGHEGREGRARGLAE